MIASYLVNPQTEVVAPGMRSKVIQLLQGRSSIGMRVVGNEGAIFPRANSKANRAGKTGEVPVGHR